MSKTYLREVYDKYFEELFALGRVLGLTSEQTTEVIANIFTDLWKMGDSIQGEINTKAFLYSSTRNYSLKLLRNGQA